MTDTVSSAPEVQSRSSSAAVVALALGAFSAVILEFVPVGTLPQLSGALGISQGTAGFFVTGPGILAAITAPVASVAIRSLDRRVVIQALTFLVIASGVISALSDDFVVMLIARFLLGVSVGGVWAVGVPAATRLVAKERVHWATTIVYASIAVGSVISVPSSAAVAAALGWRAAFFGAAGVAAIALIVQVASLPRIPAANVVRGLAILKVLSTGRIAALLGVTFLLTFAQFAAYTFVVPYLHGVTGLPSGTATLILLGYGVLTIVGNFGGGALAGRDLRSTVLGTVALGTAGLLLFAFAGQQTIAVLIALVLWGLGWGNALVAMQLWLQRLSTGAHAVEASNALFVTTSQLAIAAGSLVGGVVVNVSGVLDATRVGAWVQLAAFLGAVALLLGTARRRRHRR